MTNKKGFNVEVAIRKTTDENYTEIDYNKKVFTDYNFDYSVKRGEKTRNSVNYEDATLQYRWLSDEQKAKVSIFDETTIPPAKKDTKETTINGLYAHLSLNELCKTYNQFSADNAQNFANIRWAYFNKLGEFKSYLYLNPDDEERVRNISEPKLRKKFGFEYIGQLVEFLKYNPEKFDPAETLVINIASLKKKVKEYSLTIAKGILSGGIKQSETMVYGAPFMFYDIDVKENEENPLLYETNGRINTLNHKVYQALEKISVLCFRSSRKLGISGVLYVPALENVFDNKKHVSIAVSVLAYINKHYLPTPIVFDKGQSQFTLGRRFPPRLEKLQTNTKKDYYKSRDIILNKEALEFDIPFIEEVNENSTSKKKRSGSSDGKKTFTNYVTTSDFVQNELNENELKVVQNYNRLTNVLDLFIESGVYEVATEERNGWVGMTKTADSSSSSTFVNSSSNSFKCHSESLKGTRAFHLLVQLYFEGDVRKAYESIAPVTEEVKVIPLKEDNFFYDELESEILPTFGLEFLNNTHKRPVKQLYMTDKGLELLDVNFFDLMGYTSRDKEIVVHLAYKDSGFPYEIESIRGTDVETVIDLDTIIADPKKRFLTSEIILENCTSKVNQIESPCGTGKTTVWLSSKSVEGMVSNYKVLFVMPRTSMILQQLADTHVSAKMFASFGKKIDKNLIPDNIEFIPSIGNNPEKMVDKDGNVKSGFLTYAQFANPKLKNVYLDKYDFIVFDESHLLSVDDFNKSNDTTITKIEQLSKGESDMKIVMMSATPETEIKTFLDNIDDFKVIKVMKSHSVTPEMNIVSVGELSKPKRNALMYKYIMDSVEMGRKAVVYMNHGDKIKNHWTGLQSYCESKGLKVPTKAKISSDNIDTDAYNHIIIDEAITSQVTYTTAVLNVGINISGDTVKKDGVSFFFDALDKNHAFDLPSQIEQLIKRNRERNSYAYIFCSFVDNEDKEDVKAYATYNPYVHLESDITPNDYILSRKHNVNMLRLDKYEMKETHLQSELSAYNRESHKLRAKYKKTIYSAIRYFNRIGYKMNYILDEKNEKGIKLDTDNTKFSLNLLKLLIESEGINDVKELEIVKTTGELSSDVTYDDITFKFHEAYSATFDSIVRSYIKLKLIYPCKETLIKVIGYIIDNESALKTIESRLISYRQRYKMAIEYKVIIKALESEISKLELSSYDEKQVENAKRLTVNFAFKIISDKMVKDFKNGEYSMRLSKLDETAMRIALMTKIEELIEKLYKNFYTSKSFRKKIEDTVDKEDTSVYTTWKDLSRMSIIKSSEQYSLEADASLFEQAMSTLSSKDSFTIDDSLDGLITRLNGALDEKYFDVFMLLDYTAKTTFSMMFVGDNQDDRVKFANAIKKFNAENKNFRGEYAFICVDKYGNVVALEVKLDDLFDRLTEKGIVKKMRSFRGGVEYFRRRSFKTKYSDCKNYTVKKIMIK